MKKYLFLMLIITGLFAGLYLLNMNKRTCPLILFPKGQEAGYVEKNMRDALVNEAFGLLKSRRDNDALVIFEKILGSQPDNLDVLWGKAEVLRRSRDYRQAEELLNRVLKVNPQHAPSLISLSYIRYKDDNLKDALKLINQVLKNDLDNENKALAFMMLGSINSRRSKKGGILSKVAYGTHIKGYFLKARELAADLPEVHLGLGTFYLLAPAIVGGDLDKAFQELELTVKIAPEFATANARLAQAYKKKGDLEKYNFYLQRARELDPENEVLRELINYEKP